MCLRVAKEKLVRHHLTDFDIAACEIKAQWCPVEGCYKRKKVNVLLFLIILKALAIIIMCGSYLF